MRPVGYLLKTQNGLEGERGACYDYVLASNGLFIETEGPLLAARIPVAECEVRGLAELEPKVVLRHGKIPKHIFDLALNSLLLYPENERYVGITWKDRYHVEVPNQAEVKEKVGVDLNAGHGSKAGVSYLNPDSVVLDMHTHPKMPARFSGTDNRDETGLKLYGVYGCYGYYHEVTDDMSHDEAMGWLQNNQAAIHLRVGVYGYFYPVAWKDVFDGDLGHEIGDLGEEEVGVSRELLEEALEEPGLTDELKEDIADELHRRAG
jgi:hypothetical protein